MIIDTIIKDDALPSLIFKKFQDTFLDYDNMSWYFLNNTAYNNPDLIKDPIYQWSFYHLFMAEYKYNSPFAPQLEAALAGVAQSIGINLKSIYRIRAGFIPVSHNLIVHEPHVDGRKTKYTALLYMNDSDGDTFFYNELYDEKSDMPPEDYYEKVLDKKVTIKEKITPKANRFVCFDSRVFHSSSTPLQTQARVVINFNFD